MTKQYSIAEARHSLAALVHELERVPFVQLTRRRQPVAVLISMREFARLQKTGRSFWEAYSGFRSERKLAALAIEPAIFAGVRDRSPGRKVKP